MFEGEFSCLQVILRAPRADGPHAHKEIKHMQNITLLCCAFPS